MRITHVRTLNDFCHFVDALMAPIMYLVSGTFRESPQQTHTWHVQNLSTDEEDRLDWDIMASVKKVKAVPHRGRFDIRFHLPILGGWKEYIVLSPEGYVGSWHIGWCTPSRVAVHRIPLIGPVRMLRGPDHVRFFAIAEDGHQLPIQQIGSGTIGDGGPHRRLPLL